MARNDDRLARAGRALTGGDPRAFRDSLAALTIAGITSLVAGITLAEITGWNPNEIEQLVRVSVPKSYW